MRDSKIIFENEEAVRLLDYFITYKGIVSKNENPSSTVDNNLHIQIALPELETVAIK